MCGIFCEVSCTDCALTTDKNLLQSIRDRGPDCFNSIQFSLNEGRHAYFSGAILWMQGLEIQEQPIENEKGVLLYNGDIFDNTWDINISDTGLIMDKLSLVTSDLIENYIVNEIRSFKGPFSLIYYDKVRHNLYFTRDRIGRNSLLFHMKETSFIISSVLGRQYKCIEIPATHIYQLNLSTNQIVLHEWSNESFHECSIQDWWDKVQLQQHLPDEDFKISNCEFGEYDVEKYHDVINYMENVSQEIKCKLTAMRKLMESTILSDTIKKVTELLEKSIRIRLQTQPNLCKNCLQNKIEPCNHCTVGILFSGGLDCTILALLADKYIPNCQKIDLINVAFKKGVNATYDVPDRLSGRQSFKELKRLCPSRDWSFMEVNVPQEELEMWQYSTISDLLYPRQSILDESLGSALWFASRGVTENSMSSCRILLVGSGADELFGGYTRHRNAFKRRGWIGLEEELILDWKRISFRNLARDNRVICNHGRQPRMPYLDEDFTDFVLKLPPWLRCFPNEGFGPGIGDKLMLRLVALNLGLTEVVTLPKRALQFGSRIANKKEKGSNISKLFLD